jgi:DNA-binding response OmpR family regulator
VSVLLLHHDAAAAASLAVALQHAGFQVSVADPGAEPAGADAVAFDVVALGMKGAPGERVQACERLRTVGYGGAIVIVGASPGDVEPLLDAGADDFVPAPVQEDELIARLRMARRRVGARARRRWGPVELELLYRTASLRGQALTLTDREYGLLACLVEAGGEVVSRAELLSKVWERSEGNKSNLVEVHVSRLRDKLGADADMIETVRGAGYRLRVPRP